MKNRTILGVLCLIAALLTVFGLAPLLTRLQDGRTNVVRMVRSVDKGHLITESDVETVEAGAYNLPDRVVKDASAVVGKYASVDLRPGDWVLSSKLTETPDSASDVFRMLNGEKRAVSVTVSGFAAGLSGKLENGDIVSVCVVSGGETFVPPELTYVRVITATTGKGIDKDEQTAGEDGSTDAPATVTLLVNEEQEKLLVHYDHTAKIHFALVFRGETNAAMKFLEAQNAYFETEENGTTEESDLSTEEESE